MGDRRGATTIDNLLQSTQGGFETAQSKVKAAKTFRHLVARLHVPVPATIRFAPEVRRARAALARVATDEAKRIIDSQLSSLGGCNSSQELIRSLGPLRVQWELLRGRLPAAYRYANTGATKLQGRINVNEKLATGSPSPDRTPPARPAV